MRNSDVDSAVYWLGRMIDGGEDPVYIARRLVRFASEDIGLADNTALNLAVNTFQACRYLGLPECDVHLTQCVIYLSVTPKSNAVYKARIASEKISGRQWMNLFLFTFAMPPLNWWKKKAMERIPAGPFLWRQNDYHAYKTGTYSWPYLLCSYRSGKRRQRQNVWNISGSGRKPMIHISKRIAGI